MYILKEKFLAYEHFVDILGSAFFISHIVQVWTGITSKTKNNNWSKISYYLIEQTHPYSNKVVSIFKKQELNVKNSLGFYKGMSPFRVCLQ